MPHGVRQDVDLKGEYDVAEPDKNCVSETSAKPGRLNILGAWWASYMAFVISFIKRDVTVQTPSNRRGPQEPKALILRPLPPRGGGLGWGGLNGYLRSTDNGRGRSVAACYMIAG